MAVCYLGLGSNVGDREGNLKAALQELRDRGIAITACSSIIETDPVGGPRQGRFLNAVAKAETSLSPEQLLERIKDVELALGRVRTVRNGPRTIDIDILIFNDIVLNSPSLQIPHPRMRRRDFVMAPLAEIEPDLVRKILDKKPS